jgi:hypothetical protein
MRKVKRNVDYLLLIGNFNDSNMVLRLVGDDAIDYESI